MIAKGSQDAKGCERVCVGEIDTNAPFRSVKDAVTLFGEGRGRYIIKKPNPGSAERILGKETKLHLAKKELNKLKEKIKNAETAKAEALLELEKAKETAGDLFDKLKAANDSKDSDIRATEPAKNEAKQSKQADSLSSAAQNQDLVKAVTSELDGAKESLHRIAEEESALRRLVESLKLELENVKKEHRGLKEKEATTESIVRDLRAQIQKGKIDLQTCYSEESKASDSFEDTNSKTAQQLLSETENTSKVEELKTQNRGTCSEDESKVCYGFEDAKSKTLRQLSSETENASKAEELKETGDAQIALRELKEDLGAAFAEAEEAKAAEESAVECINSLSERAETVHSLVSESNGRITISSEEIKCLKSKVEQYDELAEIKVAAALAQVGTMKISENEEIKKLEMGQKEIQELKVATVEALKKAEVAEEVMKAMEGEIRRWREREQKKAAVAASWILSETKKSVRSSSTHHSKILKHNSAEKFVWTQKREKAKTCVSKKVLLPSVSRIFHRRKIQDQGRSVSCLPN